MNLRCSLGWHKYGDYESVCVGATMSWGGNPTPQYDHRFTCERCGHEKWDRGYILPYNVEKIFKRQYDDKGWPLDDNGNRLPIAAV